MPTEADRLIAEARELQRDLNSTLDALREHGVVCHSVVSYRDPYVENSMRFAPLPLTRVALVLEMKVKE